MSDLSLIFVLVFLAASLAVYGVYWVFVFNRRTNNIVNRRLDLAEKLDNASAVLATLRDERGIRDETNPILRHCSDWLTQTGIVVQRSTPDSGVCGGLPGAHVDLQFGLGIGFRVAYC